MATKENVRINVWTKKAFEKEYHDGKGQEYKQRPAKEATLLAGK